jgi:hypothetical protein
VNFLFRVADPSDFVVQKEFVLDFGPSAQNERLDFALVGPSGDFEVAVISPKSAPAVRHFLQSNSYTNKFLMGKIL